jgi:lipid II:glycine glycyltransferase (peptidoglycan interpeptide bridge formation enzyme)
MCFVSFISLDWHHQIEELKAKLVEATTRAAQAEHELVESRCKMEHDVARAQEDLLKQRDRYERQSIFFTGTLKFIVYFKLGMIAVLTYSLLALLLYAVS